MRSVLWCSPAPVWDPQRMGRWLGVVVGMLVGVVGCYPVGELQGPTVLQPGQLRVGMSAALTNFPGHADVNPRVVPTTEFGLRLGLIDRVDLGVRVTPASAEAGVKLQLVRADELGEVDVSLAPAAIYATDFDVIEEFLDDRSTRPRRVTVLAARMPVFLGLRAGRGAEPWIAVTPHVGSRRPGDHGTLFLALGGSVGIDLRGEGSSTVVQPQLSVLVPLAGSEAESDTTAGPRLGAGDPRVMIQLNVFFDTGAAPD